MSSGGVSVALRADGLLCTLLKAAVVAADACISKLLEYPLPCRLVNTG